MVPVLLALPVLLASKLTQVHPAVLGQHPARGVGVKGAPARAPAVPFTKAAHRVIEGPFIDTSRLIDANGAAFGPFDVPARGYLRAVWFLVTGTGGVIGTGVLHEDYPFNAIANVNLVDPNSVQLVTCTTGFSAVWGSALGAYRYNIDPADYPGFVATINCEFAFRVPVEINPRTGYGALLNQNADTPFRVTFSQPVTSTILSTVGTATPPTIRYRAWAELWTEPTPQDMQGSGQALSPPLHPTYQYLTETTYAINSGFFEVPIKRLGRLYRNMVMIFRSGSPATRDEANFPDDLRFTWDAVDIYGRLTRHYVKDMMAEAWGSDVGFPSGLFALTWADDNDKTGFEDSNLYLPILSGARLSLQGTWGTNGTLTIVTNDVAPARLAASLAGKQQL